MANSISTVHSSRRLSFRLDMLERLITISPMNIQRIINFPRVAAAISIVILVGTFTQSATAGTRKIREEAYRSAYDVVQAVNAAAHTVTVATMVKYVDANAQALAVTKTATPKADAPPRVEKTVTFTVTKFSEVIVNGKSSDLSAVQVGMKVDVTKGTTETQAARIVATQ